MNVARIPPIEVDVAALRRSLTHRSGMLAGMLASDRFRYLCRRCSALRGPGRRTRG